MALIIVFAGLAKLTPPAAVGMKQDHALLERGRAFIALFCQASKA
jgi:hypothetical protein